MSKISLHLWVSFSILLFFWMPRSVSSLTNKSGLCLPMDLPCKPDETQTCLMKYYKLNSTECRDMTFNEDLHAEENILGNVELKSYLYDLLSFKTTGLNVTFTNIKWNHLKFRFKQMGNDMKNTCREFYINSNAVINDLFYDCLWSNETYEGKTFFFEYEASGNSAKIYRKFSFLVPYAFNIDKTSTDVQKWELLTYVDLLTVSIGLGPTKFLLYWQPLPDIFPVEDYNVSVMVKDAEGEEIVHSEIVKCNNAEKCSFIYSKWLGTVRFGVQPLCQNATDCKTSYTNYFQLGGNETKPLLIGITCATFIVPILFFILCKIRRYITAKERLSQKSLPKILVIYSPALSAHSNVVLNFVEYLKNYCKTEPLVDELHISLSKSKDPFKWCNESFKKADIITVIASPGFGHKKSSSSIYRNTDALLLRMLRENLGMYSCKKKYFVLMMPYSTERDIPKEAENLRKFHFPRDLNKILRFIHGNRIIPALFGCEFQGGKKEYQQFGKKLSYSIKEAQQNLKDKMEIRRESDIEEEMDSHCELLTMKRKNTSFDNTDTAKNKEQIKETAKHIFSEYPGILANLLKEEDEIENSSVPNVRAMEDIGVFDINELKL